MNDRLGRTVTVPSIFDEEPGLIWARDLLAKDILEPAPVVCGLLHQPEKMLLTGGSKSYKSFLLLDLALSVATGTPFWGMETRRGGVLLLNFELPEYSMRKRVDFLCHAKGCDSGTLAVWNLRGRRWGIEQAAEKVVDACDREDFGLVIVDPCYKLQGDGSEIGDDTIREFVGWLDKMSEDSGASIVYSHHHTKGNQAEKDILDRPAGSGVWARDADVVLDLLKHEEDDAFIVGNVQRSRKSIPDFCVRMDFPVLERDDDLDPKASRKVAKGRQAATTTKEVASVLDPGKRVFRHEWWEKVQELGLPISLRTFDRYKKASVEEGIVVYDEGSTTYMRPPSDE